MIQRIDGLPPPRDPPPSLAEAPGPVAGPPLAPPLAPSGAKRAPLVDAPGPLAFASLRGCDESDDANGVPRLDVLARADRGAPWTRWSVELGAEGPSERALWRQLGARLGPAPLAVSDRAALDARLHRAGATGDLSGPIVDLVSAASLLLPGRLPPGPRALERALIGDAPRADAEASALGENSADRVRAAWEALVRRFRGLGRRPHELLALGAAGALARMRGEPRARTLELLLALVEHASTWADASPTGPAVESPLDRDGVPDGFLGLARARARGLFAAVSRARPAWALTPGAPVPSALPVEDDGEHPLDDAALEAIDRAFRDEIPRLFAAGGPPRRRDGQRQVALAIARTLGRDELLLVHAPTGTGKTLAYLVPALLWASAKNVRFGIATYTRALQEQAMTREVPLALAALEALGAFGPTERPRVQVLKGRRCYLCWRAFALHAPEPLDAPEYWLAWTALALFALTDPDGDLDRFPLGPPLPGAEPDALRRELGSLLEHARAQTGCCAAAEDLATCGAAVARWRAERAHVVLTNHAFALSRPEFFKHLVFDECEHLHAQAHEAFSSSTSAARFERALARVSTRGRAGASVVGRLCEGGAGAGPMAERATACLDARERAAVALGLLEDELERFLVWRREEERSRVEAEKHSLFREHAGGALSLELRQVTAALEEAANEVSVCLSDLSELLAADGARESVRARRSLDRARVAIDEELQALRAWLPLEDGEARFSRELFNDVEEGARGEKLLVARVLLPDEYLGRNYFPRLRTAAFVSATTWLRGGFEAAGRYLGLARAVAPAPEEVREPCRMRCERAEEVFDYARVQVLVPRDAPPPNGPDREAVLDYAARFAVHLGERTRGRMLVLFTNAEACAAVGRRVAPAFAERGIPFWYQRMEGTVKEELADRFRSRRGSVLFGLDTFWFGADFPGETLEYLVIARLPYGVPDRYHHAQCAAIGADEQRRRIYMPRALAKFRQGFGRLMRRESDRGCVFVLDQRILEPRHRAFLTELPLAPPLEREVLGRARLVRGDTDDCVRAALEHMGIAADARARGLSAPFADTRLGAAPPRPETKRPGADDVPF